MRVDKRALRRHIGEKKRAMSAAEIEARSAALAEKLYATDEWRLAKSVYAYMAFNQEVRTRPVIERAWAEGKRVAVPKVVGGELRFIWLGNFSELAPQGAFGIPEPVDDFPIADDDSALVMMPGLAFERQGHRVGYGGGYYDRWLAAHPGHPTVALCFGFQVVDGIEAEAHDMAVDRIIADDQ